MRRTPSSVVAAAALMLGALVLGLVVGTPAPAEAQQPQTTDAQARSLFESGRSAYEDARYDEALPLFMRSYELSRRPALLYNIAQCQDRLRMDAQAIASFERYLAEVPDASNRSEVEIRLGVLRARLVPTASQTAQHDTPQPRPAPTPPPAPAHHDDGGLLASPIFWTIVGVVVVAAAVAIIVVATSGGTQSLPPGDVGPGGVVLALEGR